ncbi:MAG TPA: hypothetical protein VG537_08230 [Candidatus Kapabacteria bacterium]|jgi:hypothetical protein|nr:hypothetical protein [Candidatus Kapabacteria bacterium]
MIKDSLLKSCIHDLAVCQHLHSKFDASQADWRPRENMRTTTELMQYLSFIGGTMTKHFIDPPADREAARNTYRANSKNSKENVTIENFHDAIEREKDAIREAYSSITDADLSRMTYHMFSNEESSLFDSLLTVVKYLTAYRHQLFLYAKMCGAEISTPNNWYGMDPQPAPVKKTVAA